MRRGARWFVSALVLIGSVVALGAQQGGATTAVPARGGRGAGRATGDPTKPLTRVVMVSHDKVVGCENGGSLVNSSEFLVQCAKRARPGVVEVHTKETDVF